MFQCGINITSNAYFKMNNIPSEPFITVLTLACLQHNAGGPDGIGTSEQVISHLSPPMGWLRHTGFPLGQKRTPPRSLVQPGSPTSQVWGARRGTEHQPCTPRKYPHHWWSTDWPQTPPGLWGEGIKKWVKRKKWDGVDCWEERPFTMTAMFQRPGTCSCKMHTDWCARVTGLSSSPKEPYDSF